MPVHQPLLIVITGPVGAGKSTTSVALAQALRRPDFSVAVIDLDQIYVFARQEEGYGDQSTWTLARSSSAVLANTFFASGLSLVIVEGEFFTEQERDTLLSALEPTISHLFFTVNLSYEQTLSHAQHDPFRGGSKEPAVLQSLHASFVQSLPFLRKTSIVVDTNSLTVEEVVSLLLAYINKYLRSLTPL